MQLVCERRYTASETGELESSRKAFTSARASQSARTIGTWPAAARRQGWMDHCASGRACAVPTRASGSGRRS